MKKTVWLCILLAVGWGCAGSKAPEHASRPGWGNYSVQLPGGWKELDFPEGTLITKDGAFSQYILVQQRPVDKPFEATSRTLTRGMAPQEVAEVLMHEMETDPGVVDFQLIQYGPVPLDGRKGFRMVFRYSTKAGIPFKTHFYGLLYGNWFYSLRYNADESKSTPEDMETFERVVESFRIGTVGSN